MNEGDSEPAAEYRECLQKAAFTHHPVRDFELLETMLSLPYPQREAKVLRLYVGLGNTEPLTLEQIGDHATAFGEDQGRYVVTSRNPETIQAAGFPMTRIGTTGGDSIRGAGREVPLDELRRAHEGFFPALMGADAAFA